MRIELHLILWVTAIAVIATAILRGFWEVPQLSLGELRTSGASTFESLPLDSNFSENLPKVRGGSFPEIDVDHRPMFNISTDVAVQAAPAIDQSIAEAAPVLKGIVKSGESLLAVFSVAPEASPYVVVAVGDNFQGYRVRAIEADFVTAQTLSGDSIVTFKLRGAGELP